MQVQHLLFFCYYLGSAFHTSVRAVVAFLVHRMGRDETHTIILAYPPHHLPFCPPQLTSPNLHPEHLHPVPAFPTFLIPGPYMGLCGFQLLPDVSLILGAGKQLLPLIARALRALGWDVGHGQRPECPVQLHSVTCSVLSWRAMLEFARTAGPSMQDSISISAASA